MCKDKMKQKKTRPELKVRTVSFVHDPNARKIWEDFWVGKIIENAMEKGLSQMEGIKGYNVFETLTRDDWDEVMAGYCRDNAPNSSNSSYGGRRLNFYVAFDGSATNQEMVNVEAVLATRIKNECGYAVERAISDMDGSCKLLFFDLVLKRDISKADLVRLAKYINEVA